MAVKTDTQFAIRWPYKKVYLQLSQGKNMGIAFLAQPPDPSAHCPVLDRVCNNLTYYLP